jgi:AcrR family transcriptional regulator
VVNPVSAPEIRSELHERLVTAAQMCFRRLGVGQTTMDDIIAEAGVPRATAYRHAGSKNELIADVLVLEAHEFLSRLGAYLERFDKFADALVEGVVFAVSESKKDEMIAVAIGVESLGPAAVEATREKLYAVLRAFVEPRLAAGAEAGLLRPGVTADYATEWLARVISSLVVLDPPHRRNRDELRRFLHAMLVPAFVSAG